MPQPSSSDGAVENNSNGENRPTRRPSRLWPSVISANVLSFTISNNVLERCEENDMTKSYEKYIFEDRDKENRCEKEIMLMATCSRQPKNSAALQNTVSDGRRVTLPLKTPTQRSNIPVPQKHTWKTKNLDSQSSSYVPSDCTSLPNSTSHLVQAKPGGNSARHVEVLKRSPKKVQSNPSFVKGRPTYVKSKSVPPCGLDASVSSSTATAMTTEIGDKHEFRKSVSIPPHMVTNLARKFNALSEKFQPVVSPVTNGGNKLWQRTFTFDKPTDVTADSSKSEASIELRTESDCVRHSPQNLSLPLKSPLSPNMKHPGLLTASNVDINAVNIKSRKPDSVARQPNDGKNQSNENDVNLIMRTDLFSAPPKVDDNSRLMSVKQAIHNYEISYLKSSVSSPELQRKESLSKERRCRADSKSTNPRSRTLPTALIDLHQFPKDIRSANNATTLPNVPFRRNITPVGSNPSSLPLAIGKNRDATDNIGTVRREMKVAPVKITQTSAEPSISWVTLKTTPNHEEGNIGKSHKVPLTSERSRTTDTRQYEALFRAQRVVNTFESESEAATMRPALATEMDSMDLLAEIESYSSLLMMPAYDEGFNRKHSLSSISSCSSSSVVPNISFLWKESTQTQVQPNMAVHGSNSSVDNFSDIITSHAKSSDDGAKLPFTNEKEMDEPLYEELFKFASHSNRDCVRSTVKQSVEHSMENISLFSDDSCSLGKEMLACDTSEQMLITNIEEDNRNDDESWIDTSESDNDESMNFKSMSKTRLRIGKRRSTVPGLLRRSWSQSLRDLANAHEEISQQECVDSCAADGWVEVVSSDVLKGSSSNTALGNCDIKKPHTPVDIQKSTSFESNESLANEVPETQKASCKESKVKKAKRHWTWSKAELKLEISSKLDKMRLTTKKAHSSADLPTGNRFGASTELQSSKKLKQWHFKSKSSQSKDASGSDVKSTRPVISSTQFYLPTYNEVGVLAPKSCDESAEYKEKSKSLETTIPPPAISNSRSGSSKRFSVSSTGSAGTVARPKTAPPAPPLVASSSVQISGTDVASSDGFSDSQKGSEGSLNCGADWCGSTELYKHSSEWVPLFATTPTSVSDEINSHSGGVPEQFDDSEGLISLSREMVEDAQNVLQPSDRVERIKQLELSSLVLPDANQMSSKLSPFNDEPLYQFYNAVAQLRAVHENRSNDDGHDSDSEPCYETIYQMLHGNELEAGLEKVEPGGSGKMSAMELVRGTGGGIRTLWCEVPEVKSSGVLDALPIQKRRLQEAMFEVITSEASYLKSLTVLVECFAHSPLLCDDYSVNCVLNKRERHILFSDVLPVKETSERLLSDLEIRWQESIVISEVCDILLDHATKYFDVYVKYCSNQLYQDRCLKRLKETNASFVEAIHKIELSPACQQLSLHSFLMLPMQRITRLPLLVDAIFQRLDFGTQQYEACKLALATLNKIVHECNEGAHRMERMEEMLNISHQLDFRECRCLALISASRWLVKKGELFRLVFVDSSSKLSFGRRCAKQAVYLFLFTDLLIVTKKKNDECYNVLDYCPRNLVQATEIERPEQLPGRSLEGFHNIFQLSMLQNHDNKTVEMFFSCSKESELTRWVEAVTPRKSENPDERIYEEWDCPQVQAIHSYIAQQPDELSLEESDVVNVFRKMVDGWYQGERIRDGVQGWFPSNYTVEIVSSHIRARNLRQRYRLLALSHSYVESRRKKEFYKTK